MHFVLGTVIFVLQKISHLILATTLQLEMRLLSNYMYEKIKEHILCEQAETGTQVVYMLGACMLRAILPPVDKNKRLFLR